MNMDERVAAWIAEVEAAYADGGYAAGDGPEPPLEEMQWLAAEVSALRSRLDLAIEALRGFPRAAAGVYEAMLDQNAAIFEEGNRGPTPAFRDAWSAMLRVVDDTFAALESVAAEIEEKNAHGR